ncbi:NADH-quinone oxidoreductase subunit L [soil metagenome]
MEDLLVLIPALPLAAAVINFLFGRWYLKTIAGLIAIAAVAGSFVLSLLVFIQQLGTEEPLLQELYTWIPAGQFTVPLNLYVDHLTAVMLMVVTSVSLLVHIYSTGYMHGDPGYYRFFSYLPLFVFSMLMLVLADNFLVIFLGWELVGLSSYLLIGYYFRRTSANDAAKKAFIVNRIGDFGFGIGIMLIFVNLGTIMFADVFAEIGTLGSGTITIIALLLFTGAIGKSAQLPLFVWLPDAMEGPTPVSALIHAATMVTAGVYMVARTYSIFIQSPDAMLVVAVVGAVTAIVAATIAITQYDIKRVVAYSTVSQLGFMIFALGVGAWVAAIFHLMTHAFFKGLLFLGSGSVIHGMHEEQDMRRMGGLKKYMPITYWTFLIAAAANAGIFPLAGFWSKDEILVGAYLGHSYVIMTIGFIAAFFTSLYMFRVVFLTFHGKERFDTSQLHPHESPMAMALPLVVLGVLAAVAGFAGFPPEAGWIHDFLHPVFALAEEHHITLTETLIFAGLSTAVALGGLAVAYLAYMKQSPAFDPNQWSARVPWAYSLLYNKWYFDEIYQATIVRPLHWISTVVLWQIVDVRIIDGIVNGVASSMNFTSGQLRKVQTGFVANYALAIALGAVIIVGVFFIFASDLFV